MTVLDILAGWLGWGREVAPPPSAPPQAQGGGIPVLAFGEAAAAASPLPSAVLIPAQILAGLGAVDAVIWAPLLSAACQRWGITSLRCRAAWLATVLHESRGLRSLVESLDYSVQGLANTWPNRFAEPGGPPYQPTAEAQRLGRWTDSLGRVSPAAQEAIAERVYGGRLGNTEPGDGWRYRGRGLIQLTGRDNYAALAAATGRSLPEVVLWLGTRAGAAESAAWWWMEHSCNALAEAGDMLVLRRRVNGGTIGLEEVRTLYTRALLALQGVMRERASG